MHRERINQIINSSDNAKIKQLGEITAEAIDIIKEYNDYDYEDLEDELYEIVEGKKIDRKMADEWVASMKPEAKWTYEQVNNVVSSNNLDIRPVDAYVIFNMLYTDMQNSLGSGDTEDSMQRYINGAKDWYFDEDLKIDGAEKLYRYRKYIVYI